MKKQAPIFFAALIAIMGLYLVYHISTHQKPKMFIPPTLQMPTKVIAPVSLPQPCTTDLKNYPSACDAS